MNIAHIFTVACLCLGLSLAVSYQFLKKKNRFSSGKRFLKVCIFLASALIYEAMVIELGSYFYLTYFYSPDTLDASQEAESQYFMFQTISTVGYGGGFYPLKKIQTDMEKYEIGESDYTPEMREYKGRFHRFCIWCMIAGPIVWVFLLSLLISIFASGVYSREGPSQQIYHAEVLNNPDGL